MSVYIAYGSESGNAKGLAFELYRKIGQFSPTILELNNLLFNELSQQDILLVLTSSTGDGEPPSNARVLYQNLIATKDRIDCKFAVFGLGDVMYENFCGFSMALEGLMRRKGATAIAKRVDADSDYDEFFEIWSDAILAFLELKDGAIEALSELKLQVVPD